ncbi:MAG: aminotransferase class V-fold PLP-dependent enzyme, partial [Methyloligellaceae bacterium]
VVDAIQDHIALEAQIGGHPASKRQQKRQEAVYESVARLIGASPDEIALAENSTLAWQLAFYGLAFAEGDRILTSRAEYGANYVAFLQMRKRTGCVIDVIPDGADEATDPEALERMIDGRVKLIAVTWIPTNGGLVNPAAEIGRVARAHGIPYLLDACQAVGQMPVDVEALGCDFLTAAGRKWLRGPRATAFLYVRKAMLDRVEPAIIDHTGACWAAPDRYELRADARRYESFEHAVALRLGLGVAIDYAERLGIEAIRNEVRARAQTLREELAGLPGVTVRDIGSEKSGLVTFSHDETGAAELAEKIHGGGIHVSVSTPDSTLLDASARRLPDMVRASPHYYNSMDELAQFIGTVREAIGN